MCGESEGYIELNRGNPSSYIKLIKNHNFMKGCDGSGDIAPRIHKLHSK
jgi:hypothetical protein